MTNNNFANNNTGFYFYNKLTSPFMKTTFNLLIKEQLTIVFTLVFGKYSFQPQPLYWAMVPANREAAIIRAIK